MTIPTEPIGSITRPLGLIEAVTLRASIVPPCISTRPLTSADPERAANPQSSRQ